MSSMFMDDGIQGGFEQYARYNLRQEVQPTVESITPVQATDKTVDLYDWGAENKPPLYDWATVDPIYNPGYTDLDNARINRFAIRGVGSHKGVEEIEAERAQANEE